MKPNYNVGEVPPLKSSTLNLIIDEGSQKKMKLEVKFLKTPTQDTLDELIGKGARLNGEALTAEGTLDDLIRMIKIADSELHSSIRLYGKEDYQTMVLEVKDGDENV